jgi:hypothetical protein
MYAYVRVWNFSKFYRGSIFFYYFILHSVVQKLLPFYTRTFSSPFLPPGDSFVALYKMA